MGYARANWRSGLTYRQVCPTCRTVVVYMDHVLDYRPWFPDGFVYCTLCKKPLRHNENYAINAPQYLMTGQQPAQQAPLARFCARCGKAFGNDDHFCTKCGAKR